MDEAIVYDPKVKQTIRDLIFNHLYKPLKEQFQKQLEFIVKKNSVLIGATHRSFVYKGEHYVCDRGARPRIANKLHPSLYQSMEDYLQGLKKLNTEEIPYVLSFITQTLNASNNLHDYLRVFPESIHQPIRKLIDSCPCRAKTLTEKEVADLQAKNQKEIEMMKTRMVSNLLI